MFQRGQYILMESYYQSPLLFNILTSSILIDQLDTAVAEEEEREGSDDTLSSSDDSSASSSSVQEEQSAPSGSRYSAPATLPSPGEGKADRDNK